jgi:adenosine deaminase
MIKQTDDVGFFCSTVSNEYSLAAEHFQLNRTDVINISRKAIDAIFGGRKEKERLRALLDEFESAYN